MTSRTGPMTILSFVTKTHDTPIQWLLSRDRNIRYDILFPPLPFFSLPCHCHGIATTFLSLLYTSLSFYSVLYCQGMALASMVGLLGAAIPGVTEYRDKPLTRPKLYILLEYHVQLSIVEYRKEGFLFIASAGPLEGRRKCGVRMRKHSGIAAVCIGS